MTSPRNVRPVAKIALVLLSSSAVSWSAFAEPGRGVDFRATYLGGSVEERGRDVVLLPDGDILVSGRTGSPDFVGRRNDYFGGTRDAYVARLSPTGEVRWSTFVGGSKWDRGRGLAIDPEAGTIVLAGVTSSLDLVAANNGYHGGDFDAFVTQLDFDGNILWSTYLGGSEIDSGRVIACRPDGTIVTAGFTKSETFNAQVNEKAPNFDAFVTSLTADGEAIASTYIGGGGTERARGLVIDEDGTAIVHGLTGSRNLPLARGEYGGDVWDGFFARVTPEGELLWTSYVGGSGRDEGWGLDIRSDGSIVGVGRTSSTDFTAAENDYLGGDWDVYLVYLTEDGELVRTRYLGGRDWDDAYTIRCNAADNAFYILGFSKTPDLSRRASNYTNDWDGMLTLVEADGPPLWSLYMGGSDMEYLYGLQLTPDGKRAVIAGSTWSDDFARTDHEWHGGPRDAIVITATAVPVGPLLTLSGSCAVDGAEPVRAEVRNLAPGDAAALFVSPESGRNRVFSPYCGSMLLALSVTDLRFAGVRTADAEGRIPLSARVLSGAARCGDWIQVVNLETCEVSNPIRTD